MQTTLFTVANQLPTKKDLKEAMDAAWADREVIALQVAAIREGNLSTAMFVETQMPRTPRQAMEMRP